MTDKYLTLFQGPEISSSVPMYLSLGEIRCLRLLSASLPNITKKSDSFECWLGSQLCDAVARGAMLSHSLFLEICFAKHDLRKL